MESLSSSIGLVVIFVIYLTIGVLAATGSAFLTKRYLSPKAEQIFYAAFLIAIAAFYLAFNAYFATAGSWKNEWVAVALFTVVGLAGISFPMALIVGYPLHGLWDFLHELSAHSGVEPLGTHALSAIPLAYGAFCAAFDFSIALYLHARRRECCAA